jgi:hypothetical protein
LQKHLEPETLSGYPVFGDYLRFIWRGSKCQSGATVTGRVPTVGGRRCVYL